MAYFLEMQFSDGRWQRNPTPFQTRAEAEAEGRKTVAMFSGEALKTGFKELDLPDYTGPKFRIVEV